jgi:hypothetical protein
LLPAGSTSRFYGLVPSFPFFSLTLDSVDNQPSHSPSR